jgi:CMP-N,N'-diacetyllegionaminic acid synthase
MLLGKPLITHTIEQAIKSQLFEHVVISTDSDEIASAAAAAGGEIFFRRAPQLATDTAAKIPAIRDAFQRSEEHFGVMFDMNVDLDATSPLRSIEDIRNAVDLFIEKEYDSLITGMPSRRSPYFNIVEARLDGTVYLSKSSTNLITRRQDAPLSYDMNASIYVWNRRTLLSYDTELLENTGIYVMPEDRSIDIDSELDFRFVEFIMRERS